MRTSLIAAVLASLTWGILGCGDGGSQTLPPAASADREAQLPGVPTDGPESKAKKK